MFYLQPEPRRVFIQVLPLFFIVLKKKKLNKKYVLILIGVIAVVLVCVVVYYSWYFSFDQRVNRILANNVTNEKIWEQDRNAIFNELKTKNSIPIIVKVTNSEMIENLLAQLSDNFQLKRIVNLDIAGNATIIAIEQLINNLNVTRIYYNFQTRPSSG